LSDEYAPVMHKTGCGFLAFEYKADEMKPGKVVRSANVRLIDGSTPVPNSQMTCGSCGGIVEWMDLREAVRKRGYTV
jgi:hypothetical protein